MALDVPLALTLNDRSRLRQMIRHFGRGKDGALRHGSMLRVFDAVGIPSL